MNPTYRTIDANLNRISEGVRVLEDMARFRFENPEMTEALKTFRHRVRKNLSFLIPDLLEARDADNDPGLSVSQSSNLDTKRNAFDLAAGNFKRIQEGLRVVEENLKTQGFDRESKAYEALRYESYTLEKEYDARITQNAAPVIRQDMVRNYFDSGIYCITAEDHSNGRDNLDMVGRMIHAGIKIIQYREKDKPVREKLAQCRAIRKMTRAANVLFIVNDDVDIALAVDADGLHVGQDDMPLDQARRLLGPGKIIGLSTHSPDQAEEAVALGADYIGVGPIFRTHTKKDVCDPVGFEYLEYAVKNIRIPFVAIGGIKEHNAGDIFGRGAVCACLVTEITGAEDVGTKINNIKQVIQDKRTEK